MKITVILTSYNHEKFLRQSIESVLQQSYKEFEFIIVDDCSSDSSWNIICEYKRHYPEIKTIRHEYNWGGGTVEDTVRNYATGDYIALHHSDDLWELDKLKKQVEFLTNHKEYAAVFTNAKAIDDEGNLYNDEDGFYFNLFSVKNRNRYEWLRYFFERGNCLCHPSILIRRDVYMENNFFRKGLKQIPDFVKWIQICKRHEIYVIPEPLVKFRVHRDGKNTSGMTKETQVRSTVELFWMLNEYRSIVDKDEFLKVFPETKDLCKDKFIPEFALGKWCINKKFQPYTHLFGETLLYEVLNDPYKSQMAKKYHHFDVREFAEITGRYDIFGILPKGFEQKRTLYIDYGNGWDVEGCIVEKYILRENEEFLMMGEFTIPANAEHIKVRFDPAEDVMVWTQLSEVYINTKPIKLVSENALCTVDGADYFVNLDPIYSIEITNELIEEGKLLILIKGEIRRLNDDEIGKVVMEDMYRKRDAIQNGRYRQNELEKEIKDQKIAIEECNNIIKNQNELLYIKSKELEEREEELTKIKNTRAYKVFRNIYTFLRR